MTLLWSWLAVRLGPGWPALADQKSGGRERGGEGGVVVVIFGGGIGGGRRMRW